MWLNCENENSLFTKHNVKKNNRKEQSIEQIKNKQKKQMVAPKRFWSTCIREALYGLNLNILKWQWRKKICWHNKTNYDALFFCRFSSSFVYRFGYNLHVLLSLSLAHKYALNFFIFYANHHLKMVRAKD